MMYHFKNFEQPIISKKQAEEDAMQKGLEGLVVGLAAGLFIGTAVTLLLAPKSGKQTREDIKDVSYLSMCDAKDKAIAAGEKVKESAETIGEKVKEKFSSKNSCCDDENNTVCCCEEDTTETKKDEATNA